MAAINLVTGYRGQDHVTAPQWADLNRGIIGDSALLPVGNEMEVEIQTANQITVSDGVVVYDGREFYIGYGESVSVAIASGTQGMLRNDIVVVQYEKDQSTGVESAELVVVEGTPAASDPQDPAYSDQDIRTGVFTSQKPFCRVRLNGTAIEGIDMLVGVSRNINEIESDISALSSRTYTNVPNDYATIMFTKRGGTASISIANLHDLPVGQTTIATVPAGYRPYSHIQFDISEPVNDGAHFRITLNSSTDEITVYTYDTFTGRANALGYCAYILA